MINLIIAIGGAIAATMRFWMSNAVNGIMGHDFPYGTLAVNVTGALTVGFLSVLILLRLEANPEAYLFLVVGLLGAFTRFFLIFDGNTGIYSARRNMESSG